MSETIQFEEFQKIARLSRECVVTEKIDGTNGCVYIVAPPDPPNIYDYAANAIAANSDLGLLMFAGSRTRWITPEQDNHGFAKWVKANAAELWSLGPGRHFGEWWGSGIQRGYGLPQGEKRFSLFNVARWHRVGADPFVSVSADPRKPTKASTIVPACCDVVPTLYRGSFDTFMGQAGELLDNLRVNGSLASPGFMQPEGVVVFHTAGGYLFKKTLEKDEAPKSLTA